MREHHDCPVGFSLRQLSAKPHGPAAAIVSLVHDIVSIWSIIIIPTLPTGPNDTIQSLLRWSDPSSVDGYAMPSPEDHAKLVDAAYRYPKRDNALRPEADLDGEAQDR